MTEELLLLALLGGVLGLDGTSVGQFMVSRPLVAGALAGWVLGDVASGVGVGAILELYLLVSFPTGGARFPEGATATVVAVGVAFAFDRVGGLPLGVAWGLVWGQAAGLSVTGFRHLNARTVPETLDRGIGVVGRVHLASIVLDAIRAGVLTFVGIALGRLALTPVVESWPLSWAQSNALLLIGGSVSIGILLNDWGGVRKRGWLFALGAGVAVLGMVLT